MEVQFFYNNSDARKINKNLTSGETFTGQLRDSSNVIKPVIRFEKDGILIYNFAYIPAFRRYYTVVEITSVRDGIWDVSLEVDVLMSFRQDILALSAVVDKQSMREIGDEYIDDGSLVADNICFTRTYEFPNGFNSTGEYILITAG